MTIYQVIPLQNSKQNVQQNKIIDKFNELHHNTYQHSEHKIESPSTNWLERLKRMTIILPHLIIIKYMQTMSFSTTNYMFISWKMNSCPNCSYRIVTEMKHVKLFWVNTSNHHNYGPSSRHKRQNLQVYQNQVLCKSDFNLTYPNSGDKTFRELVICSKISSIPAY